MSSGTEVRTSNQPLDELIVPELTGRDVLDVGCVDHAAAKEATGRWLHKKIRSIAKDLTGLDILEQEAEELNRRGYRIVVGDACRVKLGRKFDAIMAGELIEHIDAPAMFLENMGEHLNDQGRLVLTTPYPFYALHWVESQFFDVSTRWNYQHVAWYDPFTLENLLERCGFRVEKMILFARSSKLLKLMKLTGLPCPKFLCASIFVVARRDSAAGK